MADGFPPLPKGFTPVEADGFPALPKGFTPAKPKDEPVPYKVEGEGVMADVARFMRDNPVARFGQGFNRAPEKAMEGIAQLGIRAAEQLGIIDSETSANAQSNLGKRTKGLDQRFVRGDAGAIGEGLGEIATTAAAPMGAVVRGGKLASAALTVGKRALVGGATAAVSGGASETASEQDNKAITGAVLTPLAIPIMGKVFSKLGEAGGNLFNRFASAGVGKDIYDANGALTKFGRVLKARISSASPDAAQFADDALKEIAALNPKRLPADAAIIPTAIASKERVPLTGGMKTRDAKSIQDFESLQVGSVGTKEAQEAALAKSKDIDSAVRSNIVGMGSGRGADSASVPRLDVANRLTATRDAAKAEVDRLYEPLNKSSERIKPSGLKAVRDQVFDDMGEGAQQTLGPVAKQYIARMNALAAKEKTSFGSIWKLSKDLNSASSAATGNDIAQLKALKKGVDDYIKNAPADIFDSGANGSFAQLRAANAANRAFNTKFAARDLVMNGGRTRVTDKSGKAVEQIIGLTKAARAAGEEIPHERIEAAIFGQGKALDSAGAKQATRTIQRIMKADPSPRTAKALKDITLNRILTAIEGQAPESLSGAKLQTTMKQIVGGNSDLLSASGFTRTEITRLQQNAYLAALKAAPEGARNVGSGKFNRGLASKAFREGFRNALRTAMGALGYAGGGLAGAAISGAATEGATKAAATIQASRLARSALSDKVATRAAEADTGKRVGRKVGQVVGAQTARSLSNGS